MSSNFSNADTFGNVRRLMIIYATFTPIVKKQVSCIDPISPHHIFESYELIANITR